MPLMLERGDVLLFSQGVNKAVLVAQKLISVGRDLNANIVHAGLVTNGGNISPWGTHAVEIARAVVGGAMREQLKVSGSAAWHRVDIWRAPGRLAATAQLAAQVGMTWTQGIARMPFTTRKAFMAGFGSASFGTEGQRRAQEYYQHRNKAGGPPSLHDPSINKSVYCSMFVVAVFQAALGNATATEMDVDARNVSPMKLHDVVNRKGWSYVGAAFDTGASLHVVKHNGDLVTN